MGREDSVPTGRFRESEFHWPLSGDEFEERSDAARPKDDYQALEKPTFNVQLEPTPEREARKEPKSAAIGRETSYEKVDTPGS